MPKFVFKLVGPKPVYRAQAVVDVVPGIRDVEIVSTKRVGGYGSLCRDEAEVVFSCSAGDVPLIKDYLLFNKISCDFSEAATSVEVAEVSESDAPTRLLDLSVPKLRMALATGDYDMYLEALLEAEQAGKTRKTAVAAIEERIGEEA
tara:strand:- start:215 stop:655 length:441 start_codon:yes stop_codon:yes gene_type:complete